MKPLGAHFVIFLVNVFFAHIPISSAILPTKSSSSRTSSPPTSVTTSPPTSATPSSKSSVASSPTTSSIASSSLPTSFESCDFEAAGLCGWLPVPSSGYTFRRHRGPTRDRTSGPDSDHTLKGNRAAGSGGHYVFSSGWDAPGPNQTAGLRSPPLIVNHPSNMSFWYQMNGQGIGSLAVYLFQLSREGARRSRGARQWMVAGRQGLGWHRKDIRLTRGFWQIEFRTTVKHNYGSDIALDDFSFDPPVYVSAAVTSNPQMATTTTTASTMTSTVMTTGINTSIFPRTTMSQSTKITSLTSSSHDLSSTMKAASTHRHTSTVSSASPSSTIFVQPTSTSIAKSSSERSPSTTSVTSVSANAVTSSPTSSSTSPSTSRLFSSSTSTVADIVTSQKVSGAQISGRTSSSTSVPALSTSTRTYDKSTSSTKKPKISTTISSQPGAIISSIMTTTTTKKPFFFPTSTPTTPEKPKTTTKKEDAVTPTPPHTLTTTTPKKAATTITTTKKKNVFSEAANNNASHGRSLSSAEKSTIIGVSVGLLVLLILTGVVFECRRKKRSQNGPAKQGGIQQVIALQTVHIHQEQEKEEEKEEEKVKDGATLHAGTAQNGGTSKTQVTLSQSVQVHL